MLLEAKRKTTNLSAGRLLESGCGTGFLRSYNIENVTSVKIFYVRKKIDPEGWQDKKCFIIFELLVGIATFAVQKERNLICSRI
jgi:hypothetical protein